MVSAWKTISASPEIWNACLLTWRRSWLYRNLESRIFRIGCCSICSLVLMLLGITFPLSIMQTSVSVFCHSFWFLLSPSSFCFTVHCLSMSTFHSCCLSWWWVHTLGMSCFRVFADWGKRFVICYALASFIFFFSLIGTTLSWEQALLKLCRSCMEVA